MAVSLTLYRLADSINDACGKPICSQSTNIPNSTKDVSHAFANATNTALLILGFLAVIFVIVGGFQYVLSGGNPGRTKQARETIIYAMVGLVLASSAYIIVKYAITGL